MAEQPRKPKEETPMERLERLAKKLLRVPKAAIQESKDDRPQPQS